MLGSKSTIIGKYRLYPIGSPWLSEIPEYGFWSYIALNHSTRGEQSHSVFYCDNQSRMYSGDSSPAFKGKHLFSFWPLGDPKVTHYKIVFQREEAFPSPPLNSSLQEDIIHYKYGLTRSVYHMASTDRKIMLWLFCNYHQVCQMRRINMKKW